MAGLGGAVLVEVAAVAVDGLRRQVQGDEVGWVVGAARDVADVLLVVRPDWEARPTGGGEEDQRGGGAADQECGDEREQQPPWV